MRDSPAYGASSEVAQQVGDAERVAGDGLPVLVLVLGGGPAREREQGLVLLVPGRGWPSWRGRLADTAILADAVGRGRRTARRSIMETVTRNAAGGDGGQAEQYPAREHHGRP